MADKDKVKNIEDAPPKTAPPPTTKRCLILPLGDVDQVRDALRGAPYRDAVIALKILDTRPVVDVPWND